MDRYTGSLIIDTFRTGENTAYCMTHRIEYPYNWKEHYFQSNPKEYCPKCSGNFFIEIEFIENGKKKIIKI